MDIYTKLFLKWVAIFTVVILGLTFVLRMSGLNTVLFLTVGYLSAIVFPARHFAESEKRLPKAGELAKYTLLWAFLFSVGLGSLLLGLNLSTGQPIAFGAILQLVMTSFVAFALIGLFSFLINTRLYLASADR